MKLEEGIHLIVGILVLAIILSFNDLIKLNPEALGTGILFAAIIIIGSIGAKKIMAYALDANAEHSIWAWSRYGYRPEWHLKREIPAGIIVPLILSAFSIGYIKCMTLFTYETTPLKRRAAKRFGLMSFTEMTDFHNAIIGGAGIIAVLIISAVSYSISIEPLARMAAFYAFWNMIPFSKLDGTQILAGSRVLWTCLAILTLIFTVYSLLFIVV